MGGSVFEVKSKPRTNRWWLTAICVGGALLSAVSHADDRRRGNDDWRRHGQHFERHHDRDHRHDSRRSFRDDNRRWDDRRWDSRSAWRRDYRDGRRYYRPDWHFYNGRYWAPPRFRGSYCSDRRHFHGVHYHVAARDYYDYYYPRFRSYGPRPYGANASVIITVPLF